MSGARGSAVWVERTWPEIQETLAGGCVAILPVGATEPHGPHLPLSTDVIIAEEMSRRCVARLAARGRHALVLPAVAYSVTDWSDGFAGRLSLPAETARTHLCDVIVAAQRSGAACVAIANAHLEPAHVKVVRDAVAAAGEKTGRAAVFPDVTRRKLAERLGDAFRSGDHAGGYETALVLAARPDLVREPVRRALEPVRDSLIERIQAGARSFAEAGMTQAYTGDPARATRLEGERLFDILGGLLEEAVLEALGD